MSNSCSSITVGTDSLESVPRRARVHPKSIIFEKSIQLLAYANGNAIIERARHDITATFNAIERQPIDMGLAVNLAKAR